MSSAFTSDEAKAQGAIEEILKFYKVKQREVPDSVKGLNDRLDVVDDNEIFIGLIKRSDIIRYFYRRYQQASN